MNASASPRCPGFAEGLSGVGGSPVAPVLGERSETPKPVKEVAYYFKYDKGPS